MEHTKGPWRLVKGAKGWFIKCKEGCVLGGVNRFPEFAERAPECEGNAHLMAAAPDMFEACKAIKAFASGEVFDLKQAREKLADCEAQARAAIAKASKEATTC